jgi:hypothetical protein
MKRIFTILTIISFTTFTIGCYTVHEYQREESGKIKESQSIVRVVTVSNNVVRFDSDSTVQVRLNLKSIDELSNDGIIQSVPIDSVKTIHTKDFSIGLTALSFVTFVAVAGLVYIEILRNAANRD